MTRVPRGSRLSWDKHPAGVQVPGGLEEEGKPLELGLDRHKILSLAWLSAFAVGMAYVESAVVVYLRLLYYPDGFVVGSGWDPAVLAPAALRIEIYREVATIGMLVAVALLAAGRGWWKRLAYFMWVFAVWDIFYYVWLFVLLRWPPSLLTLDVLFLIPKAWVAPVLLPVTISGIMMTAAAAILRRT